MVQGSLYARCITLLLLTILLAGVVTSSAARPAGDASALGAVHNLRLVACDSTPRIVFAVLLQSHETLNWSHSQACCGCS